MMQLKTLVVNISALLIALSILATASICSAINRQWQFDRAKCSQENPAPAEYDKWVNSIGKIKARSKKDSMLVKAKALGFDDYADVGDPVLGIALARKFDEEKYLKNYSRYLYVIDANLVTEGTMMNYNVVQKFKTGMNFLLTSPTFPGDMPGPLLLGVKMNDTSSAKKNDPLCLYGWYFKLDKVVKVKMTDGFEVLIPVLIPLSEK